jgi:hypothetical protein
MDCAKVDLTSIRVVKNLHHAGEKNRASHCFLTAAKKRLTEAVDNIVRKPLRA